MPAMTQRCTTCAHYKARLVNTKDQQTGTFNACALDPNHPGARFANPAIPCRLVPIKWAAK